MGTNIINITGQKFNKLTAINYVGNESWLFKCDCNETVIKKSADVKRGKIKACSRKCLTGNPIKHPLYYTWDGIKKRCYQKNSFGYENYGGRGIIMCDEWKNSFWTFVNDMGEKPSINHTIERINNNDNYYKENCKWSTKKEQSNNRRNNIFISYQNKIFTLYNLCKILNLKHSTVYWNLKKSKLTPQFYFEKYIF